ncbi:MAG: hypothetical protein ACQGVK_12550 [Myxococcota bacterium]
MSGTSSVDRRSPFNVFRVEQDITRRQLSHLLAFTGVFVLGTTLAMGAHYFLLHHGARGTVPVTGSLLDEFAFFWSNVAEFRLALVSWALSITGLSILFAVGLGAHFARTFAGPVHALKRDLEAIERTGLSRPVQLRDGDQLLELAESINRALASVARTPADPAGDDALAADRLDALRSGLASRIERLDPASLPPEARERVEAFTAGLRDLLDK